MTDDPRLQRLRRLNIAVTELVGGIIERHYERDDGGCAGCYRGYWPCPDVEDAEAVLDQIAVADA
jgi:hypothetical protein